MNKIKNNKASIAGPGAKVAKRSIFILNKNLQFKYAILLALIGGGVSALFSIHLFYFLNENIQIFIPNFMEDPEISGLIFKEHKKIIVYLASLTLLLMSILFFFGVIITHKMVGPVMVIRRKMEELSNGNLSVRVHLRKGDEFNDLADSFNSMAEKLEKSRNQIK
jgi:methyl-accepting chemotaxis protein